VNYWWKGSSDAATQADSALNCLLHCMLNLKHLAPEHREAWRAIFDHYVFNAREDAAAHIPENKRGVLGPISPELEQQMKAFLVSQLQRKEAK
jgi:hypothetical protein